MRELPAGWIEAPLDLLVDVLDAMRVPLNASEREQRLLEKSPECLYPYYGATGQVGLMDDYLFDEPLILLGEDGVPFFDLIRHKAYLVEGKCWVNNHAHVLRAISAVADRRYLVGFLNLFDYTGFVTGSTRLKLTQAAMRSIPVRLAPLSQQKRIADKLDALLARADACRERLNRVPAILKRFRQAVLADATSGKLTEEWREERCIGAEWSATSLQAIAQIGTGSTPLRSNQTFYSSTGTPWITSAATAKPIVMTADEFVTDAAVAAHRLRIYPAGTLLVAMYGEGKTRGQVTELGIAATINQACAAIIVNGDRALRAFVKLVLQANYLEMRDLAEGGNQPNLNLSKIKNFPLPLPSLDEQDEIVRRVTALFAYADRIEARYSAARAHVDRLTPALLAKAFRGELVPQDPNDEPASLLLERIRAARAAAPPKPRSRQGTGRPTKTQKAEVLMLNRRDIPDAHLCTILRERGPLTAEALWSASQLDIDDFYDQLQDEEARGLLNERRGDSPGAQRLLEAAA